VRRGAQFVAEFTRDRADRLALRQVASKTCGINRVTLPNSRVEVAVVSDVNPLAVLIPAVLLSLIAYAVFQFLRQSREDQRRGQKTDATKGSGQKGSNRTGNDLNLGR
jgi:hypothetical protein